MYHRNYFELRDFEQDFGYQNLLNLLSQHMLT